MSEKVSERLDIQLPEIIETDEDSQNESINVQIVAKAATLKPGTWFQVWYPDTTEADYDVLRVVDGVIENADVEVKIGVAA